MIMLLVMVKIIIIKIIEYMMMISILTAVTLIFHCLCERVTVFLSESDAN